MQPTKVPYDVTVAEERLVSHAGVGLLAELADRLGLTAALGRYAAPVTGRARRHPPARVLRDAIVMLCDGGDCLSDLRLLTGCQDVLGPVASIPTAWRAIARVADVGERGLAGLRLARATARAVAWRAGAGPAGRLIVDLDGSLVIAHSDRKQGADGTYKHTFGFHPLLAYLDHHNGRGEPLAAILRPGSAAANDTADHLELLKLALAQLPPLGRRQLLVRTDTDSRGATIPVMWWLHERGWQFSVGLACDEHVREAVLAVPDAVWSAAIDPDGTIRDGAWVAEVTGWVDLGAYPPGTRAICRRERAHPGAPRRFTDPQGRRYQVFVTNQPGTLAWLELLHRQHARVEDRIRAAKATGLANLPFDTWDRNAVWLELVLAAQDLTCWAQALLLDGELAVAEPKRLRTRLLHTAGRLLTAARRRLLLQLPAAWPWAAALATAFARLRTLRPLPG